MKRVDLTVLEYIGYATEMKQVEGITGKPVIPSETVLAKIIAELCYLFFSFQLSF